MKHIYAANTGYPLYFMIDDKRLKRIKDLQSILYRLDLYVGEHAEIEIGIMPTICYYPTDEKSTWIEINKFTARLLMTTLDYYIIICDNIFNIPDIWFTDMFIGYIRGYCNNKAEPNLSALYDKLITDMPQEHQKILGGFNK